MRPVRFDIVGGGFRTQAFLQIAQALPDRFQVGGMFVRDEARGRAIEERWHVKTYRTLEELLRASERDFMLVSVDRSVAPAFIRQLAEHGVPALTETPPAKDLAALLDLYQFAQTNNAKIQVAEQYHLQPLNAARIALARSGKLGSVSQAYLSIAHDYHGISLMRKVLGIQFENATISAREFVAPLTAGPTRAGLPTEDTTFPSRQVFAFLDFGEKLGIYDFSNEQYRSWIRSVSMRVRGERGEINDTRVRYLEEIHTPIHYTFERQDAGEAGNVEGYFHRGYMAGGEWIYRNPFLPGRLNDDEIAIATCLEKMAQYVNGGPDFYSLEEASQDHYLSLMIQQALETRQQVQTSTQPWARAK
jgi:predicted dehydrogenase